MEGFSVLEMLQTSGSIWLHSWHLSYQRLIKVSKYFSTEISYSWIIAVKPVSYSYSSTCHFHYQPTSTSLLCCCQTSALKLADVDFTLHAFMIQNLPSIAAIWKTLVMPPHTQHRHPHTLNKFILIIVLVF